MSFVPPKEKIKVKLWPFDSIDSIGEVVGIHKQATTMYQVYFPHFKQSVQVFFMSRLSFWDKNDGWLYPEHPYTEEQKERLINL